MKTMQSQESLKKKTLTICAECRLNIAFSDACWIKCVCAYVYQTITSAQPPWSHTTAARHQMHQYFKKAVQTITVALCRAI